MTGPLTPGRLWAARGLAMAADLVQIVVLPAFVEGAGSPFADVLDVVLAVLMTALVGWHWAFAPAFVAELVPFVDLAPTWTIAVWVATRGRVTDARSRPGPPQAHA